MTQTKTKSRSDTFAAAAEALSQIPDEQVVTWGELRALIIMLQENTQATVLYAGAQLNGDAKKQAEREKRLLTVLNALEKVLRKDTAKVT